jgi:hypothetical protein
LVQMMSSLNCVQGCQMLEENDVGHLQTMCYVALASLV